MRRKPGVKLQLPLPSAVAEPSSTASAKTVTVELASAVPVIVGVVSAVEDPLAGSVITGALGAIISTGAMAMVNSEGEELIRVHV